MEILDPKGTLILILRNPTQQSVAFEHKHVEKPLVSNKKKKKKQRSRAEQSAQHSWNSDPLELQDGMPAGESSYRLISGAESDDQADIEVPQTFHLAIASDVAPECVLPCGHATESHATKSRNRSIAESQDRKLPPITANDNHNEIHYRVSLNHLRLASRYFSNRLDGTFPERMLDKQAFVDDDYADHTLVECDWDKDAFLLLLNIIHNRHDEIPGNLKFSTLLSLAELADWTKCHRVARIWVNKVWFPLLTTSLPTSWGLSSEQWLFASWVFEEDQIFGKMTELAMKESRNSIGWNGLPFPKKLIGDIEVRRERAVRGMVKAVQELESELLNGKKGCTKACQCLLLGALCKGMAQTSLDDRSTKPLTDFSVKDAREIVLGFETPAWGSDSGLYGIGSRHDCQLRDLLQPTVDKFWASLTGLEAMCYPVSEFRSSPDQH